MQSLQNQFVKAVDADVVHIIAPYIKIITYMYPQPLPFTKLLYLQMRNETTDCCCQNFFESQSLTSHDPSTWYNGKRHHASVY